MARYNHEQQALFIDSAILERIVETLEPICVLELEYLEDGDVKNKETLEYYTKGNDLIVVSDNNEDDEVNGYISGRTSYGTGEFTVRKDFSRFVSTERKNGTGMDIRVREEFMPFDISHNLPIVINRD